MTTWPIKETGVAQNDTMFCVGPINQTNPTDGFVISIRVKNYMRELEFDGAGRFLRMRETNGKK